MSAADERFRAECRYWLDEGFNTPEKVEELMKKIAVRRGKAAAQRLREGMREEWVRRKKARAEC